MRLFKVATDYPPGPVRFPFAHSRRKDRVADLVPESQPVHPPPEPDAEPAVLRLVQDNAASAPPLAEPTAEVSAVLEDVVRRFGAFIRRTAHRHHLATSEVDDLVQDTRIRLWQALGTTERVQQVPASYVYRTVMSTALDFLRRRRARREVPIEAIPLPVRRSSSRSFESAHTTDRAALDADVQAAICRAVDLLVESRRGVVRMYLAGYDRVEIAELLGWSEAKTRNLLYRGLADVRTSLESWGFGPGARS